MVNQNFFTNLRLEHKMKMNRGLSRVVILSLLSGVLVLGSLFIAVRPAHAQATVTNVTTVTSVTMQVSGTASALQSGLAETVTFSGPLVVTATVATDPTLGPSVVVSIDGRGIKGIGSKTGTVYLNECEANLTRPFAATDVISTTFAYFEDAPGSYLKAKTGLLTLNLTYNTVTRALTKVTGSVGTL
jgi:hypothetical protein